MVIAPPASPTFSRVFSVKHPQQKSAMLSNCLARPGPTKSWTLWGVAKPWNVMCAFCWSSPSAGRVDRVDVRCGLLLMLLKLDVYCNCNLKLRLDVEDMIE